MAELSGVLPYTGKEVVEPGWLGRDTGRGHKPGGGAMGARGGGAAAGAERLFLAKPIW